MKAPPALIVLALFLAAVPLRGQFQQREPDFDRQAQQQADTDRTWRAASEGFMQADKISYRSRAGDMDIPAWVFQPLKLRGAKGHPAIVWVHENIRGHLYVHYIPYIREATAKGYVVIAPEYRGSIGYGKAFYEAIDYGGTPAEKHDLFRDRSPLYSVDKLQIPLLVHVARNDEDVNIEEAMELVDALRSRKPFLAETKVYDSPPGGHTFDRRVDPRSWVPENTREQRDSWNRVWTFLDWNLDPFRDGGAAAGTRQN